MKWHGKLMVKLTYSHQTIEQGIMIINLSDNFLIIIYHLSTYCVTFI